jgi:hypothetical protein
MAMLEPRGTHGWLTMGNILRGLPLLHTLVEERVGERRFSALSSCSS